MTATRDNSSSQKQKKSSQFENRLVTLYDPEGLASEAFRTVRTSLLYSLVDNPPQVITLTSAGPREGKSTTTANLAVVLAQAEKSVVLLDCDLRRSTVHKVFQLRNMSGVVNALAPDGNIEEHWHEPVPNLKVVTAGPIPPNPAELLGSSRFSELLANLKSEFDYVLIDAPPVQLVSDPVIIAAQSDGVLLVLDAQNTRKVSLRRTVRTLEGVGARVLGTIMNNVDTSASGYKGYTYSAYSSN